MPLPPDETFTADGTWNKPSGAGTDWTHIVVTIIGGGGGGGAGGARTNNRAGGGGGGGSGGRDEVTLHYTELASTVAVTVGIGGTGAPKRSITGTGATGSTGGTSSFGSHGSVTGGSGGAGGTAPASGAASGGSGGAGGSPNGATGGTGGSGPTSGGGGAGSAGGAAAGGGGGGMTGTAPQEGNGGDGGASTDTGGGTLGAGGSGSTDPGDPGGNASQGDARGGGGGGAAAGGVVGADGGDGGTPGAGGGGGGAVRNSTSTQSGGGGDGFRGQVFVHYVFETPVSAVLTASLGGLTGTMIATPQNPVSAVLTASLGGLTATMIAGPQTASLPMLLLNGNPTTGPDEWSVGPNDYLLVQDIDSSTNDGAIVPFGLGSGTQTQSFPITNMPGDFYSMSTLLWRIRYGSGVTDDQVSLQIRILSRTSGTILAAADAGGTYQTIETWTTPFLFKNVGPTSFTYVNTSASKSLWDDAEVEFREIYTVNGSDDNGHVLVDAFEMSGTYTVFPGTSTTRAGVMICVT